MTGVSSIYNRGPREPEHARAERLRAIDAMARRLWIYEGVALLRPDDAADDVHAQAIRNEAIRKYGRRSTAKQPRKGR